MRKLNIAGAVRGAVSCSVAAVSCSVAAVDLQIFNATSAKFHRAKLGWLKAVLERSTLEI
jgi:hypothetical protein